MEKPCTEGGSEIPWASSIWKVMWNCSVCDGFCASLSFQMPQDSLTSETLRSSVLYQQPQNLIQPSLQAEMDCDLSNPLQVGVIC